MFPTPPQQAILESGILSSGFSCLLQLATGSGKTWLAERTLETTAKNGRRGIYLAPTRALASELFTRWTKALDVTVGIFTGDYGGNTDNKYPIPFKEAHILIMTPERLDACTRHWRSHWGWMPEIDLIVVDEFHLLGDGYRGARLEGALLRMLRLNPFLRIQGLSATLGNLDELTKWLHGVSYQSTWRSVPIKWTILRFKNANEKPAILRDLLRGEKRKTLVFVQSRRRAEQLDQQLRSLGVLSRHHHAGLTLQQREQVEQAFRNNDIDVLLATPTLEVGVNLPVQKVVLYDLQYFDGSEYTPLQVNQVWQRVGRAGRPGFDSEGEAVLIAPQWDREVKYYPRGEFENIVSQLVKPNLLAEQVIAEVSAGFCRSRFELERCFSHSLAAHQNKLPKLSETIDEMVAAGMLMELPAPKNPAAGMRLKATRLGRIAAQQMLSPSTVLLFHEHLKQYSQLYFFDLLVLVCCTQDCEPCLPVDYEELEDLASAVQNEPSTLLEQHEQLAIGGKRLLSALKMAILIRLWTRGQAIGILTESFGCYEFEIRRLCESVLRLLPAMVGTVEQCEDDPQHQKAYQQFKTKIAALNSMVAGGLDENNASLTLVPDIGWKWAKRLVELGLEDIEDLAQQDASFFESVKGISIQRATTWVNAAESLMQSHTFNFFKESRQLEQVAIYSKKQSDVDPYRLRRAKELKVSMVEAGYYRVTGGQDPHIVRFNDSVQSCDCQDYEKGNTCKHLLAVRLFRQDELVIAQLEKLNIRDNSDYQGIDLLHLWSNRERKKAA